MNYIANKFASWIALYYGTKDDQEVFAYGIECTLNTIFTFGIVLIVGALFNNATITLVWLVFFFVLRHPSGGLHASNHIGCFVMSLLIGIGCIIINPFLAVASWSFILVFGGIIGSVIITFRLAPVIHKNHPLSKPRILKAKATARITILIESILIVVLFFLLPLSISIAAILGVLAASVSTLLGYLITK